jgi:hypothetical protein
MRMPGFTAELSLSRKEGSHRARAGGPRVPAALTPAFDIDRHGRNTTTTIDCKGFPDAITCHECNSTGPGTLQCCQLRKKGDDCIIINDPNALAQPDLPPHMFTRVPVFSGDLRGFAF